MGALRTAYFAWMPFRLRRNNQREDMMMVRSEIRKWNLSANNENSWSLWYSWSFYFNLLIILTLQTLRESNLKWYSQNYFIHHWYWSFQRKQCSNFLTASLKRWWCRWWFEENNFVLYARKMYEKKFWKNNMRQKSFGSIIHLAGIILCWTLSVARGTWSGADVCVCMAYVPAACVVSYYPVTPNRNFSFF